MYLLAGFAREYQTAGVSTWLVVHKKGKNSGHVLSYACNLTKTDRADRICVFVLQVSGLISKPQTLAWLLLDFQLSSHHLKLVAYTGVAISWVNSTPLICWSRSLPGEIVASIFVCCWSLEVLGLTGNFELMPCTIIFELLIQCSKFCKEYDTRWCCCVSNLVKEFL